MNVEGELILYQSDNSTQLEVRIENESVWLTQNQMSDLFGRDKSVVSRHIRNVFLENELDETQTVAKNATVQIEGGKDVLRNIDYYNLDVIISVGYRVKSKRGTQFRIWANRILKDYLMKGYAVSQRIDRIERKMVEQDQKFDLLIKTTLPPNEGVFYDGQIFDAWKFAADLIKSANKSIILIDNYIDESVLHLLSKRKKTVRAVVYTAKISKELKIDIEKFNTQYQAIEVKVFSKSHDRFLIIDDKMAYHIGASLKDLAKKWFAFSKIDLNAIEMIKKLEE